MKFKAHEYVSVSQNVQLEKMYSPHRRGGNFPGVGRFSKTKKCKEIKNISEAYLEFPKRLGLKKNPSVGEVWIFYGTYPNKMLVPITILHTSGVYMSPRMS